MKLPAPRFPLSIHRFAPGLKYESRRQQQQGIDAAVVNWRVVTGTSEQEAGSWQQEAE